MLFCLCKIRQDHGFMAHRFHSIFNVNLYLTPVFMHLFSGSFDYDIQISFLLFIC